MEVVLGIAEEASQGRSFDEQSLREPLALSMARSAAVKEVRRHFRDDRNGGVLWPTCSDAPSLLYARRAACYDNH